MYHADKTVTIYHKEYDEENAFDVYRGTVIEGVSFSSKIATAVSTDGLTAASEATLRIPMDAVPSGQTLKNGDLVCEGALQTKGLRPGDLADLCDDVYTIVGITRNTSGREPHIKVVCK